MGAPTRPRNAPGGAASSPTLLELASIDGKGAGWDGQSLVPVLQGRGPERQERFLEFHPRVDRLVYDHSIVTDRWRLTLYPRGEPDWGDRFDLEADPGEHDNLFNDPACRLVRERWAERLVSRFPARPAAETALISKS